MAEEKRQGKKWRIVKLIILWIWRILLTALIIGAIIFDVPWKVFAILLIFLAACTILPRPVRKWFWLSVAAVIVILIIWIFLPDNNKDWQPYKFPFDSEVAAINAQYKIPDKENAATIYNELLENYNKDESEPNFRDYRDANCIDKTLHPWKTQDYPEIADWLAKKQPVIEKLIEASNIERCSFPVSSPLHFDKQVDRYSAMRHWAQMLMRAASNDLGEGRNVEAFEKGLTVMRMGQQLCRQPTMIDWLVGAALEALGMSRIKEFIVEKDISKEQLDSIQETLQKTKYDWDKDYHRFLDCEKLSLKNLCGDLYEINSKGRIRFSHDPLSSFRAITRKEIEENNESYMPLKSFAYPGYFHRKALKAGVVLLWFYMPSTPQKLSDIVDKHFGRFYSLDESDFIKFKEPLNLYSNQIYSARGIMNFNNATKMMSNIIIETYYNFNKTYKRTFAENRGCQILIALKRYKNQNGQWPENLEQIKPFADPNILVDPQNNSSFVYKKAEDSFTLYSKGPNNIDEGGNRDEPADDWPIWPAR